MLRLCKTKLHACVPGRRRLTWTGAPAASGERGRRGTHTSSHTRRKKEAKAASFAKSLTCDNFTRLHFLAYSRTSSGMRTMPAQWRARIIKDARNKRLFLFAGVQLALEIEHGRVTAAKRVSADEIISSSGLALYLGHAMKRFSASVSQLNYAILRHHPQIICSTIRTKNWHTRETTRRSDAGVCISELGLAAAVTSVRE